MTQGIYCYIDNKNNSIIYIGKDSYIHRNKRHKHHLMKKNYNQQQINRVLQNNPNRYKYAILKDGNFSQNLLSALEIIYIKKYNPIFNFTIGGEGALGFKHSDKFKKEQSQRMIKNNPMKDPNIRKKASISHKNKKLSLETKQKVSEFNNSTGFFRVYKDKQDDTRQGFLWGYSYYKNNKRKKILRKDLFELKKEVEKRNLTWMVLDKDKANQSIKENKNNKYLGNKRNTTGYFNVSKIKDKNVKQGFIWKYTYTKNKKRKGISSVDIKKLEYKVKEKGLPWIKL